MSNTQQPHGYLKDIAPAKIKPNPDNPRMFFRPEELDTLMSSILQYNIQVPLTVYEEGDGFVLIDGERRWRCALKLNLKRVPALVQPKPSPLTNLLLMFNIHALREQWDYLTIANKLPTVIQLIQTQNGGQEPTETELSDYTGLTRGQIRRCKLLFDLPNHYRRMLEEELSLPVSLQRLSEDFFIEMERALKTVKSRVPAAIPDMDVARDALIHKFREKLIGNITDFRKLSKIATSISNVGVKEDKARDALSSIFDISSPTTIEAIYSEKFETRYDERKIGINIDSVYDYLDAALESEVELHLAPPLRGRLIKLKEIIDRVLEG